MEFGLYLVYTCHQVTPIVILFYSVYSQQIEDFTESVGDLGTASRAFAQAKERTTNNIKYLQRNQADLTEWLVDITQP